MNPPKVCDPLAVSSTPSVRRQLGQTGTEGLSETQKQIYGAVAERGRVSREELLEMFGLSAEGFEQEFALLRHCELLRGFKEGKTVYFMKY